MALAYLYIPVVVELMLDLHQAKVGDLVLTGIGLTVAEFESIHRFGQQSAFAGAVSECAG